MATRRRARISLGFGAAGRSGLIGSMLPTAQDGADAQRAIEIQVQSKLNQFKNGEVNFAQLEAFIAAQKDLVSSTAGKASLSATLDAARTFEIKQKDSRAHNNAVEAYNDYINGNGSLDAAKEAIRSAKDSATDPETKTTIQKLFDTTVQTGFKREVAGKVQGYNDGSVKYEDLQTYLKGALGKTNNTDLQNQITKAMDSARVAENTTQLNRAAEQYKSGQMPIEQFVGTMAALRDAPDQKDPDQIQKINAAIATAEINEQSTIDQKKYNDWTTHKVSDSEALSYFNGRMAIAKDKQSIDTLGRYAANVQSKLDQANQQAARNQASLAKSADAKADAELKEKDTIALALYKDFYDNVFKPARDAAGADPQGIANAYALLKKYDQSLATVAGHHAQEYASLADATDLAAREFTGVTLFKDYQSKQEKNLKAAAAIGFDSPKNDQGPDAGGAGGTKVPFKDAVEALHKVAETAADIISGPNSRYISKGQKQAADGDRNNALATMKEVISNEEKRISTAEGSLKTDLQSLLDSANKDLLKKAMGITADPSLQQFTDWLGKDVRGNAAKVFQALPKTATQANEGLKNFGDENKFVEGVVTAVKNTDRGTVLGNKDNPDVTGGSATGLGAAYIKQYRDLFLRDAYPASYDSMLGNSSFKGQRPTRGDEVDSQRDEFIAKRMFNHPFVASEQPLGTTATPYKVIPDDGTGLPHGTPKYIPVSIDEAPTVRSDGAPLSPEQRAYAAVLMSTGVSAEDAAKAADDNLNWWTKTVRGVNGVLEKEATFAKGLWDSIVGPVGDIVTKDFGLTGEDVVEPWKKFLGGIGDKLQGGTLTKDGWVPTNEMNKRKAEGQDQPEQAGPNFDPNHPDGIWNNLVHSWDQTVGLFGGVAAAEPETSPGAIPAGGDRENYVSDLIARSNEVGFQVNVPDQQPWDLPQPNVAPVDNSPTSFDVAQPEQINPGRSEDLAPPPPSTWDAGWGDNGINPDAWGQNDPSY